MRLNDRKISEIKLIEEIIRKADVCRVAFADNNIPYIVTMNFGYCGGEHPCLYFHGTTKGRKLDIIKINNYVCFEMDTDHGIYEGEKACEWGMRYRSVVGFGRISVLKDSDSRIIGMNCIMEHYSGRKDFSYDEKIFEMTTMLKLEIQEMTGKSKGFNK
jgi:uncharacterized protein